MNDISSSPDARSQVLTGLEVGDKIVNHFKGASAIYYIESKRIMVIAENDFQAARKALAGLELKVQRHK